MSTLAIRGRAAVLATALALLALGSAQAQGAAAAAKTKILVAAEKTEFKDAVMVKIKEGLTKRAYDFVVIDVKELPAQKAEDYRAVVILNTVMAWRPRFGARKFLDELPPEQKAKVVMVNTTKDPKWQTKEDGVHAITSASLPAKTGEVTEFVLKQVDAIVKAP